MIFLYQRMFQSPLVEIKVGSSMNSLCFVELSCINDILISNQCIKPVFFTIVGKKKNLWSNNQLSCSILRKIFMMRAGDYKQIINYDWPYLNIKHQETFMDHGHMLRQSQAITCIS